MLTLLSTPKFKAWIDGLKDRRAAGYIFDRLVRVQGGNLGDVKPVGDGLSEIRINHGPGYRIYFIRQGSVVILLLCGGDKGTQAKDIASAKKLAKELRE